jgi:hypothetical protein
VRRAGKRSRRAGTILVFFTLMMVVMIAFIALAVDYGYLCAVRAQLQRTADSAALAGASGLYHPDASLETGWYYLAPDPIHARLEARRFIRVNNAAARSLDAPLNEGNDPSGDIVLGRLFYPPNRQEPLNTTFDPPNTVRVRVPLSEEHWNGSVSLFFARVLGVDNADVSAKASATTWYPALLPFATSVENWDTLAEGTAGDNYAWLPGQGSYGVVPGSDDVPEIVMFPGPWQEGDLPPGNFGLIEIGPLGSVLENVRRQVDMGPNVADMSLHGGKLAAGDVIEGRTGLKSSTKTAFLGGWADGRDFGGILGRPRMLPLYETATGNGENAVFKLAGFKAVRVMAIRIDDRWRTDYLDTEGEEITAIMAQPLTHSGQLVQVQLTR